MPDLNDLIRDYYAGKSLPEPRVRAILAAAEPRSVRSSYWRVVAIAASLLLFVGAFHGWLHYREDWAAAQRVLAEIALNHGKQLGVEVASADFAEVSTAMDRLDFPLRPPVSIRGSFDLVGGRYCSIQGALAAQLKLRDRKDGAVHTLYATALTPELADIADRAVTYEGIPIRLWSDGTIFFGLAGQTALSVATH